MSLQKIFAAHRKTLSILTLGCASIAASFGLGIYTAGTVQPVSLIEAGSTEVRGDMNGNGKIDLEDVRLILEVAQGYRTASAEELRADPNDDGMLTVDDAMRLLSQIEYR
ncbi:MAG: hypothetical protein PHO92_01615 [Candidatus Peribacteraceae bacterium]|nr:hypothetical protein [Candidatus Peribacteraceae bacterium]